MPPVWRRCSSVTCARHAPSSRLASRAPHRPRRTSQFATRPLGARRLAELLMDISRGNAATQRRLRLELAGADSPAAVAKAVRTQLATIARASTFVDWQHRRAVVDDLPLQRRAIVDTVAPRDPVAGLDLMWRFLALAGSVFARCEDSSGTVIGVFDAAVSDLGQNPNMSAAAGRRYPWNRVRPEGFRLTSALQSALLHESSRARTMPIDRILTGRCDTTLVPRPAGRMTRSLCRRHLAMLRTTAQDCWSAGIGGSGEWRGPPATGEARETVDYRRPGDVRRPHPRLPEGTGCGVGPRAHLTACFGRDASMATCSG